MENTEEIWVLITKGVDFWDANQYEISSLGRIRTIKGKLIKPQVDKRPNNRYSRFRAKSTKKQYQIHRMVAFHFVEGYFEGAIVNHIDSNPENNHSNNLEWCTHSHNTRHSIKFGGLRKHPRATVTVDQVREIRNAAVGYGANIELAKKYGVTVNTIKLIKQKRSWPHI